MFNELKKQYQNREAIGYWSSFSTKAIKLIDIIYNYNDYAVINYNDTIHIVKIYYTNNNNSYCILYNTKLYFSECLRV